MVAMNSATATAKSKPRCPGPCPIQRRWQRLTSFCDTTSSGAADASWVAIFALFVFGDFANWTSDEGVFTGQTAEMFTVNVRFACRLA